MRTAFLYGLLALLVLRRTVKSMSIYLLLSLVLGLLGLILGPSIAKYSAKRTVAQPVMIELEAEKGVLQGVLRDPQAFVFISEIKPVHFVNKDNAALWGAIKQVYKDVEVPLPTESEEVFVEAYKAAPTTLIEELEKNHSEVYSHAETLLADEAESPEGSSIVVDKKKKGLFTNSQLALLEAADKVHAAGLDREVFAGTATLSPGGEGETLLVRRYQAPSRARTIFSSLLLGAIGALSPVLAASVMPQGELSWLLASAALFVLGVYSLIWALVDFDTMYIDFRSFFIGAGVAWGLTILSAWAAGDMGRLLDGVWIILGTTFVFEAGNFLYSKLRGQSGMGFGDTIFVVATAGIPAAISGSWVLGYYTVLLAMVCGIIGWVIFRLRGKITLNTPFAFGPYLALGWIVAFTFIAAIGLDTLEFI